MSKIVLEDNNGRQREFDKIHAKAILVNPKTVWKLTNDSPYEFKDNEFIRITAVGGEKKKKSKTTPTRGGKTSSKA